MATHVVAFVLSLGPSTPQCCRSRACNRVLHGSRGAPVHQRKPSAACHARVYGERMRRVSLAAAVAVLLTATAVSTSLAAGPTINVNPQSVPRGQVVRVFGVVPGCPRGDQVTLMSRAFSHAHEFAGVPAVFATVRRGHKYSKRTRIPAGRHPRRYAISGRCGGGNLGVTAHLRVTP